MQHAQVTHVNLLRTPAPKCANYASVIHTPRGREDLSDTARNGQSGRPHGFTAVESIYKRSERLRPHCGRHRNTSVSGIHVGCCTGQTKDAYLAAVTMQLCARAGHHAAPRQRAAQKGAAAPRWCAACVGRFRRATLSAE